MRSLLHSDHSLVSAAELYYLSLPLGKVCRFQRFPTRNTQSHLKRGKFYQIMEAMYERWLFVCLHPFICLSQSGDHYLTSPCLFLSLCPFLSLFLCFGHFIFAFLFFLADIAGAESLFPSLASSLLRCIFVSVLQTHVAVVKANYLC